MVCRSRLDTPISSSMLVLVLLIVHGMRSICLQHHISKAANLLWSALFRVILISYIVGIIIKYTVIKKILKRSQVKCLKKVTELTMQFRLGLLSQRSKILPQFMCIARCEKNGPFCSTVQVFITFYIWPLNFSTTCTNLTSISTTCTYYRNPIYLELNLLYKVKMQYVHL